MNREEKIKKIVNSYRVPWASAIAQEIEVYLIALEQEDEPRIDRIRRKYAENPEACHAILDMINQVGVREGVLEICCDENHSPNSRTDAILDYLNIPQDLVVDKETDNEIAKRVLIEYCKQFQGRYSPDGGFRGMVRMGHIKDWLDEKPYDPHEVAQED